MRRQMDVPAEVPRALEYFGRYESEAALDDLQRLGHRRNAHAIQRIDVRIRIEVNQLRHITATNIIATPMQASAVSGADGDDRFLAIKIDASHIAQPMANARLQSLKLSNGVLR